jgi:hypothetical protein
MNDWISVNDSVPEMDPEQPLMAYSLPVLACVQWPGTDEQFHAIAYYTSQHTWVRDVLSDTLPVTHWLSLPALPEPR